MPARQRVSFILAAAFVASLLTLLDATYNNGEVTASGKTKGKVVRRYDELNQEPTTQELNLLRGQDPAKEERLFENLIPKHVPLGIRIRKEKEDEFKNLKNEKWARDFELEVTNTGNKPIYHFYLLLVTDVKAAAGFRIVAPLYYGRDELGTISTLATADDIPLKPSESVILKIHPGQLEAWDYMRRTENRPHPKKIQIKLEGLSFGDGTGFGGEDGIALPRTPEQLSMDRCIPQRNKSGPQIFPSKLRIRSREGQCQLTQDDDFLCPDFVRRIVGEQVHDRNAKSPGYNNHILDRETSSLEVR